MAVKKTSGINSSHGALSYNTTAKNIGTTGTGSEYSARTTTAKDNVAKSNAAAAAYKAAQNTTPVQTVQPTNNVQTAANTTVNNTANFDYENEGYDYESKIQDYLDMINAQYAAKEAAQKQAIQAAVDQSVNSLNAQKTTTAQDYADQYRQLYLNNMKSQKNIGQQMAAQGVTGGASESTLLGLNTNYEDNLRQGKVAEQNALSTLDQAIANAQLSGSIESANSVADTASEKANAYLTAYQQDLAAQQTAAAQAASANSENRQYNYQLAMAMLNSGSMPSDALLNSAGISKNDASTIVAQIAKTKVGSGSGSGSGSGTTQTVLGNNAGYKADGTIDYITVKGYGRLTVDEVERLIANGKINKNVSNGVVTYTKA